MTDKKRRILEILAKEPTGQLWNLLLPPGSRAIRSGSVRMQDLEALLKETGLPYISVCSETYIYELLQAREEHRMLEFREKYCARDTVILFEIREEDDLCREAVQWEHAYMLCVRHHLRAVPVLYVSAYPLIRWMPRGNEMFCSFVRSAGLLDLRESPAKNRRSNTSQAPPP